MEIASCVSAGEFTQLPCSVWLYSFTGVSIILSGLAIWWSVYLSKKYSSLKSESTYNSLIVNDANATKQVKLIKRVKQVSALIAAGVLLSFIPPQISNAAALDLSNIVPLICFFAAQGIVTAIDSVVIDVEFDRLGYNSKQTCALRSTTCVLTILVAVALTVEQTALSALHIILITAVQTIYTLIVTFVRRRESSQCHNSIDDEATLVNQDSTLNSKLMDESAQQNSGVKDYPRKRGSEWSSSCSNRRLSKKNTAADLDAEESIQQSQLLYHQQVRKSSYKMMSVDDFLSETEGDHTNMCNTPDFARNNSIRESLAKEEIVLVDRNSYTYKDIKVIGHKAKEQSMFFVITYLNTITQRHVKIDRTHNDFKALKVRVEEELKHTTMSLPSMPKRIKTTGALDKKILQNKIQMFNRILFYIEFNMIKSEHIDAFLVNKQSPKQSNHSKANEYKADQSTILVDSQNRDRGFSDNLASNSNNNDTSSSSSSSKNRIRSNTESTKSS